MRILFVDQFGELGGAQQCLLDLLPAVLMRGWRATICAPRGLLLERARSLGVEVQAIACGPYAHGRKSFVDVFGFLRDTPQVAAKLRAQAADLLYVNGPRVLPAAALDPRSPVLFHAHSRITQRYAQRLAGWALRRTRAAVIANCRFVLEPLEPLVSASAYVIYNGVPDCTEPSRTPGEFRIGVVGRIAPEKGQAEFLRAARLIPDARFVICGAPLFGNDRHYRELQELAEGLPVEFTGWRDDVAAVLAGLELLVVPSTGPEATTRVILEAFAAGVPVLAAHTGGIPEIIDAGRTGFLLDSLAPEALAGTIRGLRALPSRLEHVAREARAEWGKRFTLARYRREVLEVIERVAHRGRAACGTAAPP